MSDRLKARAETVLRRAHKELRRRNKYHGSPLWYFVSDMTGHGSAYSHEICRELGWNPNALIKDPLPPRGVESEETKHGN